MASEIKATNEVIISKTANETMLFLRVSFGIGYTLGLSVTGLFIDIKFSILFV